MLCVSAMASLLEKNRSKRIGATGFNTFTNHPFFQKLDFVALEKKDIFPIFVPSSEKANFDATYDLEELLLEEAPLEARARKQKPRAELREDATQREIRDDELHRMMETMFEPFDYTTVSYDVYVYSAASDIYLLTLGLVPLPRRWQAKYLKNMAERPPLAPQYDRHIRHQQTLPLVRLLSYRTSPRHDLTYQIPYHPYKPHELTNLHKVIRPRTAAAPCLTVAPSLHKDPELLPAM